MSRFTKRSAAVLLVTAAFISILGACTAGQTTDQPDVSADAEPSAPVQEISATDKIFTVRYYEGYSFNPITGTSPDNMVLVPLMYEGLFVLGNGMSPQRVLCEEYDTDDGIHYTIKLKSGVAMHDGSTLNASDVKYTLTQAAQTGRFAGRLALIDSITVNSPLELEITLKAPNYKLPALLDIPIIKAGSIDWNSPPGSGPYYFETAGTPRLAAFRDYRYFGSLPVETIYLRECTDSELSVLFSSQAIDLFWDDPADITDITILSDHEIRFYNTTILQFVGFNTNSRVLSNPYMRRALGLTIDRKDITSTVYSAHADAAPLILSPEYELYDTAWEKDIKDPLDEISRIFAAIGPEGLKDTDSDGFLEYPNSAGSMVPFSLKFIVNGDNRYKVAAAEKITADLKAVGINVTLLKLSWSEYMAALESGSFDMYYGDVYLPADYDLSALLAPGGSVDYGNAGSSEYTTRIRAFLSASGADKEKAAAKALCTYIEESAPIIPVLYRQYAVHTNRTIVSGMNPTQSSLFYGLTSWQINFG